MTEIAPTLIVLGRYLVRSLHHHLQFLKHLVFVGERHPVVHDDLFVPPAIEQNKAGDICALGK